MPHRNLWAPWRLAYMQGITHAPGDLPGPRQPHAEPDDAPPRCFLCDALAADTDADRARLLVLRRNPHGVLMLNRYPYANGHLLAAPAAHAGDLTDLTDHQYHGLMDLVMLGRRLLNHAIEPQGVNLGINLGVSAGAGVPGHLHAHLVPRWHGDTNFMNVVGDVRVIPQALERSYQTLRAALQAMPQK